MDSVIVRQPIPVFAEPDTASPKVAERLLVGRYPADRVAEEGESRFVHLPGRGWICRSWKNHRYATLEDSSAFLPEAVLIDGLQSFVGWEYSLKEPRYPYQLGSFKLKEAPPNATNCVCFTEALLIKAWQKQFPSFPWVKSDHDLFMVPENRRYGSVDVTVSAGLGVQQRSPRALPAPWTLVQGWTSSGRGHSFFVLDRDEATERVLTLESSKWNQITGVGYREIGDLHECGEDLHPGSDWHVGTQVWSWASIKRTFVKRRMATLRVRDIRWIAEGPAKPGGHGRTAADLESTGGDFEGVRETGFELSIPEGEAVPANLEELPTPW